MVLNFIFPILISLPYTISIYTDIKRKSLFTFVCLIPRQYNYTFHELRKQLENQVVQIQIQS